jgi:hypothetical protein
VRPVGRPQQYESTTVDLYKNIKYSLVTVHTAPKDQKKVGAAIAETENGGHTERSTVTQVRENEAEKGNRSETRSEKS